MLVLHNLHKTRSLPISLREAVSKVKFTRENVEKGTVTNPFSPHPCIPAVKMAVPNANNFWQMRCDDSLFDFPKIPCHEFFFFICFAAAFFRFSLTRNFTIRLIKSYGMG